MTKKYDFEILIEAIQVRHKSSDKGYIVRYDGDLYFVCDPNNKHDINECEYWTFDVEKHFCIYDVDTEFYRYYRTDKALEQIDLGELI